MIRVRTTNAEEMQNDGSGNALMLPVNQRGRERLGFGRRPEVS